MKLFEEYREQPRPARRHPEPSDLVIRRTTLADVAALAHIEAAREGSDPEERASTLEREVRWCAETGQGLILSAEVGVPVAIAKVKRIVPPENASNGVPPGWYLGGVIVDPAYRRQGIGRALTRARLDWITVHDLRAHYVTNAANLASIEMHREFGFFELTRDFSLPGLTFVGGEGILFRAELGPG